MTAGASLTKPEVRLARLGDDIAVVSLLGEHDLATAAEVRSTLVALLEQGAVIVVDLSETEFIDSSVIYALVDGKLLASEHGSRMGFQLQTGTAVHRVLEICGLLKAWPVYGSRDEAIAALTHRPAPLRVLEAPAPLSSPGTVRSPRAAGRCLSASAAGETRLARRQSPRLEVT